MKWSLMPCKTLPHFDTPVYYLMWRCAWTNYTSYVGRTSNDLVSTIQIFRYTKMVSKYSRSNATRILLLMQKDVVAQFVGNLFPQEKSTR